MAPSLLAVGALVVAIGGAGSAAPPAGLPACEPAERPALARSYAEWRDTLLDPMHTVGREYVPPDLETQRIDGRAVVLRSFVFGPLREMLEAARQDGYRIRVTSAYRSYDDQRRLAAEMGDSDLVARPGHSEHHLGTAVDFAGGTEWLAAHASRFGFVMSYPPGRSSAVTCYPPEPWHYRYFGSQRAREITESGLSAREWLWANATANSRRASNHAAPR
jgi:zinc D-Ala-D-Ala carboxypeptidase